MSKESASPEGSLSYLLGDMNAKLDLLLEDRKALEEVKVRVTSLEQAKFKLLTVVATVAATVGFVFSNLKQGLEWLTTQLHHP